MASFEQTGQPTGYDQIQPGTDLPKPPSLGTPPGSQNGPPAASPLTTAITQPAQYPGDPSMMAWRTGAQNIQPRQQPPFQSPTLPQWQAPASATGALAPPPPGGAAPSSGITPPTGGAAPTTPSNQNLSDPATWMSMVGNVPALTAWVKQGLGPKANDQLVNYYVGKIQGQPGANATEQQGSADYWMKKLQSDPNVTGRPAVPANSPISPIQRATLFGNPAQPPDYLQSLILQLLQQSTGGAPPTNG